MGARYGFLIPDTYVRKIPNQNDMNTSSLFTGFAMALAIFTAINATKQSLRSWRRTRRVTAYSAMIWGVWVSSIVLGLLAWLFQRQIIDPSFGFYFSIALFWAIQVQLLLQIIINRVGLLMVPGTATKLKWIVFLIILIINISVFIIWMPARLQISRWWIHANEIWDRCEKVIFAIVDGCLNGYFIYLTRTCLINNGLTKYKTLFHVNLVLVALIGLMSLPSGLVYLSFHPVAYLSKLYIEMKMAELITKLVRSTGGRGSQDIYYNSNANSDAHSVANDKRSNPIPRSHDPILNRSNPELIVVTQPEDVELGISEDADSNTGQTAVEGVCVLEIEPTCPGKSTTS
ncbi:hypothetical protein F5X68DRAFT_226548 [Plectosphaerella plurivora]|uniref:Uncharacterized protein n=1 Tax=Plectosphaerella plurivora TaxID=936078 RepID=A0A9P8VN05_9PEZI|nr:hypothetical protein F5X68DRAFT_226548 [Plectosphaerella plurivora]